MSQFPHTQERYYLLFRPGYQWEFPQIKHNNASFFTIFAHYCTIQYIYIRIIQYSTYLIQKKHRLHTYSYSKAMIHHPLWSSFTAACPCARLFECLTSLSVVISWMFLLLFLSLCGHLRTSWTVLLLPVFQGEQLSSINQITSMAKTFCVSIRSTWSKDSTFRFIKHRQYSLLSKGKLLFPLPVSSP